MLKISLLSHKASSQPDGAVSRKRVFPTEEDLVLQT